MFHPVDADDGDVPLAGNGASAPTECPFTVISVPARQRPVAETSSAPPRGAAMLHRETTSPT
jgi:hypothetical protein